MNIKEAFQAAADHYDTGDYQQAEHICREILEELPDNAEALYFLGIIYIQLEKPALAIPYLNRSLHVNERNVDAYFALGTAFRQKGQLDEAIQHYQMTISLDPNNVDALNLLGDTYKAKGLSDEAITCFQKIIKLNPNLAVAHNNIGATLHEKRQVDEAVTYYQEAIRLDPNLDVARYNLGNALWEQGKLIEAEAAYDRVLERRSDDIVVSLARCMSQIPIMYPDQSSIQTSRKRYADELIKLCSKIPLENPQDIEAAAEAVGRHTPFYLPCQGYNDRELQQHYGRLLCRIMALRYPQFADRPAMPNLSSNTPLRIGIASGFFFFHSNWKIPIKGWVENLDKDRFKLYGYYTGKTKDKETEVARQSFSRFAEDINSFEDFCTSIREDDLHVLIYPEIGMDPITVRLAALRLAPVQCTSWGHPDTSGFPTIDYYLSSDLMEPPDADEHYTEKLIRLPNVSVYYTPLDVPSVKVNRDTFGLRSKSILYLCSHALFTYLPQYDEVFPRIAQQVGNCQFVFISNRSNLITEQFRLRLIRVFSRFHLPANDFVVFLPRLDKKQYHALNCMADIFLDSIGWSGCNSTFEAIACNLPVVTYPGTLMRQRHCAAILTMMDMMETIARSADEYVEIAVRLGKDAELRKQVSDKIMLNKHLIYYDKTCIAALEDFLEKAAMSIL
jgi:protein O-GlcNAc transferase